MTDTTRNKMRKNAFLLAIFVAVFFLFTFLSKLVQTSGFSVTAKTVSFVTDDSVTMQGTLYVPANATMETPAAGVLVCPGGNTPHTFYQSYSSELARRGYVVFAYDYYGVGGSDYTTQPDQGAVAAMKYLTSLSFVDLDRLTATGHSNGGGQAFAAMASTYAAQAKIKSILFIGCGIAGRDDLSVYDGMNVGAIWATYDEAGQGTFWDTYHVDNMVLPSFPEMVGLDVSEIASDTWYGDPAAGEGRIFYRPSTFHSLSNIVPSAVKNIIDFVDTTQNANVKGLDAGNLVYLWHELFTLVAAVALCAMFFPIGSILLETKFFATLKKPVPEATSKHSVFFWLFLLVPPVIMALLIKSAIMQGQTLLGYLPNLFKVQSTNGFIWWFILAGIVAIVFVVIRLFVDKSFDKKAAAERMKITPRGILKATLFALITVGIPYLCAVGGERLFGQYGRIFQTYFSSMTPTRLLQFPVYFVLYALMFSVFAYTQADTLRLKKGGAVSYYLLTLLANALPAMLFLGSIFGRLIFTHVTPIAGREMSRANGAMLGMLLLYFVVAKVVTYFYKKSGNIYVCAFVNAAFVVWVSVNTPQLIA